MMSSRPLSPQKLPTTGGAGSILPLLPIGVATFVIIVANAIFIGFRLLLPYPSNGWDAGIVTDAWRMLHGAVYASGIDHATHMYGPLVTALLAQAFRLTGPVLYVGRLASAISGIVVVAILAKVFGRSSRLAFGVAVAILLAANCRAQYYFTEIRPDMDSIFFAVGALILLYRGLEPARKNPRPALVLTGTALLVIAVLFKQTAAMFMFIPALSLALMFIPGLSTVGQFRTVLSSSGKQLLASAAPIAGGFLTFAVIRQLAPGLWHFMIEVPAQYRVPFLRAGEMSVQFLASIPLFLLAFVHWLFTDAPDTWQLPRVRWLMAALICTVPASIMAEAKDGGTVNSLIPALLCVGAFCAWRAPVAFALLRDAARPLPLRTVSGLILGIMLFVQVFAFPGALSRAALKGGLGGSERPSIIAEAHSLPGKVVCPDDPTIALMAKGYAGRTAVFEADAVYGDPARLQAIVKEVNSADYVIAVQGAYILYWEHKYHLLQASGLTKSVFPSGSPLAYELWRRTQPPGPPSLLTR